VTAASAPRELVLRDVVDLLAAVDELGESATGELALDVGEDAQGAVFIEKGRVCWAAARGLAGRLTELLAARSAVSVEQMESLYMACRTQGVPLGEHLVARGLLQPAGLSEALLQHTAESLRLLCRTPARAAWFPRSGRGYSPAFTFTTAELSARMGAAAHQDDAERLAPILRETFAEGEWGVAFVRPPHAAAPRPVALHGPAPSAASTLARLGAWGASTTDVVGVFSGAGAVVWSSVAGRSRARVAFGDGRAIVVGEMGEHGPARILNLRARDRRGGR
jgi:hypothetical protein